MDTRSQRFMCYEKKTSYISPSCQIWESLCDLLCEVNDEPLILYVVTKLSASSDVSWNISYHL